MKILVTGGAGFIGSHTCVELLEAGHDVVILDDLSNASGTVIDKIETITGKRPAFYQADAKDRAVLHEIFTAHRIDAVVHFAGFKAVGESCHIPLAYYRNNLDSTLALLEEMAQAGCTRFVFSSSATVYGPDNAIPYVETMPTYVATNPYGWTKVMIEQILRDCCTATPGFTAVLLRYFNPIGAHPSALIGELPRGVPQNLVPFITQTAAGLRECLSVFGDDYPTPDGSCIRDYIDIVDLARAHVAALHRLIEARGATTNEVFNVGTGRGVSVLELVRGFERANGLKLNYRFAPRRAVDITAIWADPTLANTLLGWRAERPREETLRTAWQWQLHLGQR